MSSKKKARFQKIIILLVATTVLILMILSAVEMLFPGQLERIFPGLDRSPMLSSPFKLCDLNHNKACDDVDDSIFESTFGKCRGDPNYNFEADFDGDGCVVTADEKAYYQAKLQESKSSP